MASMSNPYLTRKLALKLLKFYANMSFFYHIIDFMITCPNTFRYRFLFKMFAKDLSGKNLRRKTKMKAHLKIRR